MARRPAASIASVPFASAKRARRVAAVLTPPSEPRRLTSLEVSVGHACTVKYLGSTTGGFGNSCHHPRREAYTIFHYRVKPGEWR